MFSKVRDSVIGRTAKHYFNLANTHRMDVKVFMMNKYPGLMKRQASYDLALFFIILGSIGFLILEIIHSDFSPVATYIVGFGIGQVGMYELLYRNYKD